MVDNPVSQFPSGKIQSSQRFGKKSQRIVFSFGVILNGFSLENHSQPFDEAPFSYRNRKPHLYDFFVTVHQVGIKGI